MSPPCRDLQSSELFQLNEEIDYNAQTVQFDDRSDDDSLVDHRNYKTWPLLTRTTDERVRWDASDDLFGKTCSFRSRASLLLCRPQHWDEEASSTGHCFGNYMFDKREGLATYNKSKFENEAEPLLAKDKHRIGRVSNFDKFVEDRHVDAEASRQHVCRNRNDVDRVPESLILHKDREQQLNSRTSKFSLLRMQNENQSRHPRHYRSAESQIAGRQRCDRVRDVAMLDRCETDEISVLTDDVLLSGSAGAKNNIVPPNVDVRGCLGIAMPPLLTAPTPRLKSNNSDTTPPVTITSITESPTGSPKSVSVNIFAGSGLASNSDRKLLKVQRELNAILRWSTERNLGPSLLGDSGAKEILADLEKMSSPEELDAKRGSGVNEKSCSFLRVRFADPAVTLVKVRPYTTPEERSQLFFDPVELLNLEEDRANRIPGEQFECIITPSGTKFNVAVSVPKFNHIGTRDGRPTLPTLRCEV